MPVTHAQETCAVPETSASHLVHATCTCVGRSSTSFRNCPARDTHRATWSLVQFLVQVDK